MYGIINPIFTEVRIIPGAFISFSALSRAPITSCIIERLILFTGLQFIEIVATPETKNTTDDPNIRFIIA